MIVFKIVITILLLAASIYFDVYNRKSDFVKLVFYISFLTMLIRVLEDILNWHEFTIIAICLLIYVGILLVARNIKRRKWKIIIDSINIEVDQLPSEIAIWTQNPMEKQEVIFSVMRKIKFLMVIIKYKQCSSKEF